RQALDEGKIVIVAGFQGIDEDYNITTLGRGGSDTTAVALAAVMKLDAAAHNGEVGCEIYTDVDGVYTTDPRLVAEARKIDTISYDEMLELASVGAGVMHSRSIEFAKKFHVPLQVRSSFSDVEGTWIVPETEWMRNVVVCGAELGARVYHDDEVSKVSVVGTGMRTHSGVAERMFAALAAEDINLKMITTGDIKISVLVNKVDGIRALRAVHQAFQLHEPRPGAGLAGLGTPSHFRPRPAPLVEEASGNELAQRTGQLTSMEDIVVSNILLNTEEGRITIFDFPNRPGNCSRVFQAVAADGIVVDMIVQNLSGKDRAELSFSV